MSGSDDGHCQGGAWKKNVVRKELQAQLVLIDELDTLAQLDTQSLASLRGKLRRKKKGLTHSSAEVGPLLAREIDWLATTDPMHPWSVTVDGVGCRIHLNDFPDELRHPYG